MEIKLLNNKYMPSWYVGKIKFQQEADNGTLVTVEEQYLLDAVSFTDAETRLYDIVSDNTPDFSVEGINRVKISDVFEYGQTDDFFKLKMSYLSEVEGAKPKKVSIVVYVNAKDVEDAIAKVKEAFKTMTIPYKIDDINSTKILQVYRYVGSENKGDEQEGGESISSPGFEDILEQKGSNADIFKPHEM